MLSRMSLTASSLEKMKVVCCSGHLLSRPNIPMNNMQAVRFIKYKRQSSHPKLHNILEYWHKVKKGEITPILTSEKSKDYWGQVQLDKATPHARHEQLRSIDGRSWHLQQGVMKLMRKNFYVNNRNCDTVFDRSSNQTSFKFRDKIALCKHEEDFRKLELELASTVARYSFRDLVYFMDGFLFHDHKPRDLCSRTLKHLSYCFEREDKTPSSVLHLLYITGCSRNVPRELIAVIEQYIRDHMDEYSFSDFSVICFSFFVLNQPFTNFTLMDKMARLSLEHFRLNSSSMRDDFPKIISLYKMFSKSGYYDVWFYTAMGDCLVEANAQLSYVRTPAFMTLIRAYAAAGVKHDDLFRVLLEKVDVNSIFQGVVQTTNLTKTRGTRSKDINRFLWAFGSLKLPVDDMWIQTSLALLSEPDLGTFYPHAIVEGLTALTMFEVSPMNLYRKLYDPSFLCRIKGKVDDESVDYYQLLLLHQYIKIMHPEFKMVANVEHMFKERRTFAQKMDVSLKIKRGLSHVWYALEQLLGQECVRLTYLVQVSAINDIVLHLDENNRPVRQQNQYDEETADLLDYVRENIHEYIDEESENSILSLVIRTHARTGEELLYKPPTLPEPHIRLDKPQRPRKICIRVLGANQCFRNHSDTLGYVTVENKLIQRMGYEIYLVSPKEAQDMKLKTAKEREAYIRDHILKRLNVNTDHIPDTTSTEEMTQELESVV